MGFYNRHRALYGLIVIFQTDSSVDIEVEDDAGCQAKAQQLSQQMSVPPTSSCDDNFRTGVSFLPNCSMLGVYA